MKKLFLAFICLFASVCLAQAPATPVMLPHQSFVDIAGGPCAGCSLYSYAAGTNTPQATYTDASGSFQNTNPIVLDASGAANIWMGSNSYKFVLIATDGTVLWSVDQVPGNSLFNSIAPCGTSYAVQLADADGTNLTCDATITVDTVNHILNAPNFVGSINHTYNAATLGTGSDIGAQVNSIFTNVNYFPTTGFPTPASGTVQIPFGTYTQTTPIVIPIIANSTITLQCDPGTILNFTGTGDAISATFTQTTFNVMVRVVGCTVDGSGAGSGSNGIVMTHFYGGFMQDVHAWNFATGAGFFYHGSGDAICVNCWALGNKDGVKFLASGPTGSDANGTAVNNVHWYGGLIQNNTEWGFIDDYLDAAMYGPTYANSFEGIDFGVNGTDSSNSGQIWAQDSQNLLIGNNYFEKNRGNFNIQIGTSTSTAENVQVVNNHLETGGAGAINGIDLTKALGAVITGNTEIINSGTFLEIASGSTADARNNIIPIGATLVGGSTAGAVSQFPNGALFGSPFTVTGMHAFTVPGNSMSLGWNGDPSNGEADYYDNVNTGATDLAHEWWGVNTGGTAYQRLMGLDNSGNVNVVGSYKVGGVAIVIYYVGTLTTTAATSDTLSVASVPAGAHCSAQASNASAAALTGVYVPPVASSGSVVVDHSATAGGTFSVFCQY